MNRQSLLCLLTCALALTGCQTAGTGGAGGGSAARIFADPGFQLENLEAVAFLGMGQSVPDELATRIMEPLVEDHLLAITPPFMIMPAGEAHRRASAEGCGDAYRSLVDFWKDAKKIDKFKLEEFCAAVGVQGVLVGTISEWSQTRAMPDADEPAATRIAARLCLYTADTGRRVWQARHEQVFEAQQLDGTEEAARHGEVFEGISSGARRRGTGTGPLRQTGADAPRFEEVAPEVAHTLAIALLK